jgi:phosphoribosylglycinamide formyltransferase-1
MKNIAVLASGRGSNFEAIAESAKAGRIKARLALLICDKEGAPVESKAAKRGIKAVLIKREDYPSREDFEGRIIEVLKEEKIDLVVLAGFMRVLSPKLVNAYKGRIINIHPSLLPAFKGAHAIKDAFESGSKVTGVTVHFVDELMDHGPVILREELKINEGDTLASLEERIHKIEHKLYTQAINLVLS